MIDITPHGRMMFQEATNAVPKRVHLYVEAGELTGYGYASKQLEPAKWSDDGLYPELMWVFNAESEEAFVLGFFVTDESGKVLFSDTFDEPNRIQNQGDRIGVSLKLRFMGAIGS